MILFSEASDRKQQKLSQLLDDWPQAASQGPKTVSYGRLWHG
jgi:hypothetical protein